MMKKALTSLTALFALSGTTFSESVQDQLLSATYENAEGESFRIVDHAESNKIFFVFETFNTVRTEQRLSKFDDMLIAPSETRMKKQSTWVRIDSCTFLESSTTAAIAYCYPVKGNGEYYTIQLFVDQRDGKFHALVQEVRVIKENSYVFQHHTLFSNLIPN